jgi:transcriptional regulator with XRE-family HTH domain
MLRNIRERKGLSISQLAAKASIPSRLIADYEDGRHAITLAHAKLLAKALWVGIEDLMPPPGSEPPPSASSSQGGQPRPTTPSPTAARPPQPPTSAPTPAPAPRPATPPPVAPPARNDAPAYGGQQSGPPPPRYDQPRTQRSPQPPAGGPRRSRPAPPPPSPISEGQLDELRRLAAKLDIEIEQLEERIGKKITDMNRPEAKDWIKRARAMVEELAPTRKAAYGQWPEGREDQEAAYLRAMQEAGAYFTFKLFNGEQFEGIISDFTPYTITVKPQGNGDDLVLRKLAIAYYRQGTPSERPAEAAPKAAAKPRARSSAKAKAQAETPADGHDHARDDARQPLDKGIDSDRVGEPDVPETDRMDKDRGV